MTSLSVGNDMQFGHNRFCGLAPLLPKSWQVSITALSLAALSEIP